MGTVRIKRPKRPTDESRRGLIKKVETKKETFKLIGSVDKSKGELATVRVVGFTGDTSHVLFSEFPNRVFISKESLLREIHWRYKKNKFDLIEATVTMKKDKYSRIIYNETNTEIMKLTAIIDKGVNCFGVTVKELPGCFTYGQNLEELKGNLLELIEVIADNMIEMGKEPINTDEIEITYEYGS